MTAQETWNPRDGDWICRSWGGWGYAYGYMHPQEAWGKGHPCMHYVPVPILAVRLGCSLQNATVGVSWIFLYYFLQLRGIL